VETESHPQATAVMGEFKKFNDVLEGTMRQMRTGSFTAKDESETVEVVINGEKCLTQLHIEDGLLRLGAETVQERINEALAKAQIEASQNFEALCGATVEALGGILSNLQKTITEEP
jgi:DNA-binding protein YbaB